MKKEFLVPTSFGDVSGIVGKAAQDAPKRNSVIVAIHGGSYFSKYFDLEGYSLVDRAMAAGFDIINIDRPAYGKTAALKDSPDMLHQNAIRIADFLPEVADALHVRFESVILIGHSMGGVIATTIAAQAPAWPLKGIIGTGFAQFLPQHLNDAFAGLPDQYYAEFPTELKDQLMFGPRLTLSDDMPTASHAANVQIPRSELMDIGSGWADRAGVLAPKVKVPVYYKLAEHEALWEIAKMEAFAGLFANSKQVVTGIFKDAGHCIDFHKVSADFHREQLNFAASLDGGN